MKSEEVDKLVFSAQNKWAEYVIGLGNPNIHQNEKNKIVEYQTKSWADSKVQLANTKESILNLFNKAKDNVTQD